jgi:hypothetical protein
MVKQVLKLAAVLAPAVLMVGCATHTAKPYDYRAFEASNPRSILVLPPLNNSPEVGATESVYSTVTYPLAEAGYYVLPVSLVSETFKQNGLTTPADIHNVDTGKLREIFGADAALYMTVDKYGSTYNVLSSVTTVSASAKLVDLKTRALLWDGKATVVDDGNSGGNNGGGLLGMLVKAAVTQIMNSSMNRSHEVAARTNAILLTGGNPQGILHGPRSPKYTGRNGTAPDVAAEATPVNKANPRASVAAPDAARAQPAAPAAAAQPIAAVKPATAAVQPAAGAVQPVATVKPAAAVKPATAAVPPAVASKPVTTAAAVQPVAAVAPVVAQAQPAVTTPAPLPAAQLSAAERSYADALSRAQSKYQSLNPASHWYRQELYDWVMARKDEFVRSGKAPDVALKLAVAAMEGR